MFCLVSIGTTIYAQDQVQTQPQGQDEDKKIHYGAKIGGNLSKFTPQELKAGNVLGGSIGGFVNYKVMDYLTVQLEVLYMQQGGKQYSTTNKDSLFSSVIKGENSMSRITLHNFEFPLLFKGTYPVSGAIHPYVILGPALGINFGATSYTTTIMQFNNGESSTYSQRGPAGSYNYNTFQWGAYGGVGAEMKVSSYILSVDFRYRLGISSVEANYDIDSYVRGIGNTRTNTFSITAGLGF